MAAASFPHHHLPDTSTRDVNNAQHQHQHQHSHARNSSSSSSSAASATKAKPPPPPRRLPPPPPPRHTGPSHIKDLVNERVHHHPAVPTTNVAPSRDAACDRFAAHRSAFRRDGYAIIRNFLNHRVVAGIQRDLESIVDGYSHSLRADGKLAGADGSVDPSAGLPFSQRYTELYRANKFGVANQGRRSDLPAFFRREGHTPGVHAFIADAAVLELARCVMPTAPPRARPLRLYPVYMLRGKPPDALTGTGGSVDWHQDAEYTYYWYSDLNTSRAQLDEYASSIVNFWVPITDTAHELGPVQFARRPSHAARANGVGGALTRADMRCRGCDEQERLFKQAEADLLRDENLAGGTTTTTEGGASGAIDGALPAPTSLSLRVSEAEQSVEYLRISDVDAYASTFHPALPGGHAPSL